MDERHVVHKVSIDSPVSSLETPLGSRITFMWAARGVGNIGGTVSLSSHIESTTISSECVGIRQSGRFNTSGLTLFTFTLVVSEARQDSAHDAHVSEVRKAEEV